VPPWSDSAIARAALKPRPVLPPVTITVCLAVVINPSPFQMEFPSALGSLAIGVILR
jgi:hypothetical protein